MTRRMIVVAVDAMGGDAAPHAAIEGIVFVIEKFLRRVDYSVHFNVYGIEQQVMPLMASYPVLLERSTFFHSNVVVLSEDKPSFALRGRNGSSMHMMIDAVRDMKADCAVSAGNTGALMAIGRMKLGMLPNIVRPAIIGIIPTFSGGSVVFVDMGANVDCDAENLVQFAIMGSAYSKGVIGVDDPKVALLNVGLEENKGTDAVKGAAHVLSNSSCLNYVGFIEGDDVLSGVVDVVVVDGFCGNLLLKGLEAMAHGFFAGIKDIIKSSWLNRFGAMLMAKDLRKYGNRFSPKEKNGAALIGLNGVLIKSHGSADYYSFAYAVKNAIDAVLSDVNTKIVGKSSEF